jgi:hypothetical protein
MKVAAGVDVDPLAGHGLGAAWGNSDFPRGRQNTRCRNAAMDGLSPFGLFAVSAMLVFYALEHRSRWFTSIAGLRFDGTRPADFGSLAVATATICDIQQAGFC